MKNTFIAALALAALAPFGVPAAFAADEIAHAVNAVSVFTDRAVVTRTGTAHLKKGKNEIAFSGIRDGIDLRSIRAGTRVPDGVKILGVSWERNISRTANNEKIAALEAQLDELNERKTLATNALNSNRERLRVMREYERFFRRSVGEQSIGGNGGETWSTDAAALKNEIDSIFTRIEEISEELRRLENDIRPVREELAEIYGDGDACRTLSLVVALESDAEKDAEISVAYTTHSASWTPHYAARIDRDAKTLEFFYDGEISQNTGEDWKNVALTLSTAQPQVSALPPRVRRVELVGAPVVDPEARQIVERAAPVSANARVAANVAKPLSDADSAGIGESFSRVREHGAVVNFEIVGAHDVPSGTAAPRVSIARKVFGDVELRAEAAPRLRSDVYLRASAKNETRYPILPGTLSIFRDGAYLGESTLKFVPVDAEIAFFAGTEDSLSVAFDELSPVRVEHGALASTFSGAKTTEASGDVYTLTNLTGTSRKVRLRSQIKVSEVDDVKISILEKNYERIPATTPGFTLEKDSGLVFWDVDVPANGETKIVLTTTTARK